MSSSSGALVGAASVMADDSAEMAIFCPIGLLSRPAVEQWNASLAALFQALVLYILKVLNMHYDVFLLAFREVIDIDVIKWGSYFTGVK